MNEFEKLYSEDGVYGNITYGSPMVSKGLKCAVHLSQFCQLSDKKILCVGSGNGYEAAWFIRKGYDIKILELYHPDIDILKGRQIKGYAQDMPFEDNEFDLYFCCEMMEHVPEDLNIPILMEAKRVSKEVFFTIADRNDPPYNTHINIHRLEYWIDMFNDLGFLIVNAQFSPRLPLLANGNIILSQLGAGTLIHAVC